jgi:hypothetical protein
MDVIMKILWHISNVCEVNLLEMITPELYVYVYLNVGTFATELHQLRLLASSRVRCLYVHNNKKQKKMKTLL